MKKLAIQLILTGLVVVAFGYVVKAQGNHAAQMAEETRHVAYAE